MRLHHVFLCLLIVATSCTSEERTQSTTLKQDEKTSIASDAEIKALRLKESTMGLDLVQLTVHKVDEVVESENESETPKMTYKVGLKNTAEQASFSNFELLIEGLATSKTIVTTKTKHFAQTLTPGKQVVLTIRLPKTEEIDSYRFKLMDMY